MDIEIGEYKMVGRHRDGACDGGKVFLHTPQKINGAEWPFAVYNKKGAIKKWHRCDGCGASTLKDNLNMNKVT